MHRITRQFVDTPSGRLAVWTREGTGLPILLWPSILYDHTLYDGLARLLPNPLAIVDGPGHGDSGIDPAQLDGPALARSAAAIAEAIFGAADHAMVGTSWGSLVAMELAVQARPRLRAAVLFNAPWTSEAAPSLSDHTVVAMARFIPRTRLFREGVARSFFAPDTRANNAGVVDAFLAQDGFANPGLHVAVRSVQVDRHRAPQPRPEDVSVPTLVVSGEHDRMYDSDLARTIARRMAHGSFASMAGTGHISAAEDPRAAAQLVSDFLARIQLDKEAAA